MLTLAAFAFFTSSLGYAVWFAIKEEQNA